jgi:hypothetical protein
MLDFIASRVNRWLVVTDARGEVHHPGGGRGARWLQPDGTEVSLIARGDAFDIYLGKSTIYNLTLTPSTAVALASWVLRWWAFTTWFGLKSRLWDWSFRRVLGADAARRERARA